MPRIVSFYFKIEFGGILYHSLSFSNSMLHPTPMNTSEAPCKEPAYLEIHRLPLKEQSR